MACATPLGTEGGLGLAKKGRQPFFPVRSGAPPQASPTPRERWTRAWASEGPRSGPFHGGRGGPFRRPVGRFVGAVHSARGAVVRARAAARLRSRGASRGAFCAPAGGSGEAVSVGDLAPAPAGGSGEAVSVEDLAPAPAGGSGEAVSVGDLAPVFVGESGVVVQPRRSVPRGSYALALGSAPVVSAVVSPGGLVLGTPAASVSPGGLVLGTPAASASPGGSAVLEESVLSGGSAARVGPSFRGRGRRAPRSGSGRFSSRGSSLKRSSPESAVSPRPPCPAPAQEAFWTFCSPFPASEGPREPPSADVDLTAHSFDLALASEDEEFARDVDSKLLYTN